jgi:3-oxoacyl-[acyl-carrier protein] reductase
MGLLNGKSAIVTGSSRGIGRAIAERLAAEGAAVIVNYSQSEEEARSVVAGIKTTGGKAISICADTSLVVDIRRLFQEATSAFGQLDIVINNAGPSNQPKPLATVTEEEFDFMFNSFARGPFFVMQEAARILQQGGRIINISTVVTALLPPFASLYGGSKAALEAFSGVLAAELAERRITVNSILVGPVETKMLRALPADLQQILQQRTPLGIGSPNDVAALVSFLASDEAQWITNERIRCDGGIR